MINFKEILAFVATIGLFVSIAALLIVIAMVESGTLTVSEGYIWDIPCLAALGLSAAGVIYVEAEDEDDKEMRI